MAGRWYNDWAIGDRIVHEIRRTVTETDNLLFTTMTHNPQPLHLDAEAARASEFGQILVNGTFTFALMIGLSVGDTTLGTLVANLGYDKLVMPKPVFLGDTLRAETVVQGLKESRSRPDAGIVTFSHRMLNQREEIVCECLCTALIGKSPDVRLRSLLFVPGDRPERFGKAAASGSDALILDLEDSVSSSAKDAARTAIAARLRDGARDVAIFVRVNPLDTDLCHEDLAALRGLSPDAIVLPKAEGAASVRLLGDRMKDVGIVAPILPIATETPAAIFQLGSYAEVAPQLAGVTWGAEDLPAAIGATTSREEDGRYTPPYEVARSLTLFAAHAANAPAIETVYPAFRDLDGLNVYARRASRDGFTGMMAIHPSQIATINAAFTPNDEQIEHARRIVASFADAPGAGVLQVDGRMVDAPHLKQARKVLDRAGETD